MKRLLFNVLLHQPAFLTRLAYQHFSSELAARKGRNTSQDALLPLDTWFLWWRLSPPWIRAELDAHRRDARECVPPPPSPVQSGAARVAPVHA